MSTFVPQGKIELIKDVDIDVSYTHQYYFTNTDAQDLFFASKVFKTLEDGTYQRKNFGSLMVNYNADEIRECKYIRWQNKPYSTKMYYAFVTSIDYENPKTSRINYTLDVYQTYLFDMEWKQSFVEREHCKRWNNDGSPVINIEDEGLEFGDMYDLCSNDIVEQFVDDGDAYQVSFIIFGTTTKGSDLSFNVGGIPSTINYYAVPVSRTYYLEQFRMGSTTITNASYLIQSFMDDTKLVNSLVSCFITPYFPFGKIKITKPLSSPIYEISDELGVVTTATITGASTTLNVLKVNNYSRLTPIDMGNKYSNFPQYSESKLLMYPYSFTELTTLRGDALNIKNEYVSGDNLVLGLLNMISSTNKLTIEIRNYLIKNTSVVGNWDIENSLVDLSDSTLPIVDDYTASYLQSNSNANKVAVQNARNSMETTIANSDRSFNTSMANRETNMWGGILKTLGQAMIAGGIAGLSDDSAGAMKMVGGALNTIVDTGTSYLNAQRNAQLSQANTRASAKTDYNNTQATILAKVKDAQMVPATARALGGNYLFDYANGTYGVYVRKKTIRKEYADKLTDYFKQYGYKVNRLEVPNFKTRQNWNYIKMAEPNIYGNIPMDDLTQLKDIFSNGITLWHGDYIGDYSLANMEVE